MIPVQGGAGIKPYVRCETTVPVSGSFLEHGFLMYRLRDGGLLLKHPVSKRGWVKGYAPGGVLLGSVSLSPDFGETLLPVWAMREGVILEFVGGISETMVK